MTNEREVVITGLGVISPIGVTKETFWTSLCQGSSGVDKVQLDDAGQSLGLIGAEVPAFEPKKHVKPRKNMKVMSRDIQMGFVAASLAGQDAALESAEIDPERFGVIYGAELICVEISELVDVYRACMQDGPFDFDGWGSKAIAEMFPLWMLKYLPNMPACHIGIGHDARGPNDSLTLGETSGLLAMMEAVRVIERGQADVMLTGATSSRIHPTIWSRADVYELSNRTDDPAAACRPFDASRDGSVHGEGAASFVLETREHAESRGAKPLATIAGFATQFEPHAKDQPLKGDAIRRAISAALSDAGMTPDDLGHVNANGLATQLDDAIEARAIREVLGDTPVTAPKSFFGNMGAGTGAVELAASLLGLEAGLVPPTLNYNTPDADCPVNVVHGEPLAGTPPTAMTLNHDSNGRAVAVVVRR